MAGQKPSVGRIVHYVSYGTPRGEYGRECRAAIITKTMPNPEVVSLCVLNPTGQFFNEGVGYDEGESCTSDECSGVHYEGGTWHWPERV